MGNPLNGFVESFKKGYFFLEDRYYNVLDKINEYVPVYKVIDPIDKIVPSFVFLIALILFLLVFFVFISAVSSPLTATLLVVDNNGDVLGGVSIDLAINSQAKSLYTDEWGEAKLDIPASEIEAEALFSKEGFQNLKRAITLRANETISVTMQPILKPIEFQNVERTIKVLDNSTNRAVKGVTLSFECTSGGFAPLFQTGDKGEFKVVQPSNCPSMVATAEADGYNKASKAIAEGITYLKMTPKTIVGSITAIVADGAGKPVPDVTVRAIDEVKNTEEASSNTALNGTAILQNLQPGNYTVSAISPDGRTGQKTGVMVNAGETTQITISLPNIDQANIKKIYLKLIEQGTSTAVANAQVLIYQADVLIDSTASDSVGIVEKNLSNPGPAYLVVITHPDFVTKIEPNIPLKPLSDTSPLNVPLVRASIADPATSAEAIVTVVDEDNAPVKDALVAIYDSRYPKIPLRTPPGKTLSEGDLKGTCTFTNLAPGTYFARAEGGDGKAKGESGQGTVKAGETLKLEVKLVLGKGTVETFVFDKGSASQEPIAGATIDLIDANGSGTVLSSCQTGNDGKCESLPIPADKAVFVRASAATFVSEWAVQTIDIVDKKKAAVSIGLAPEFSIPPGTGKIGTEFVGLYKDRGCKTPAGFVQSDESGATRYFAKFNLIFTENVSYNGIVQHIRAGIDSEISIPLPTGYKLKLMGVTGPLIKAAPLSRCWNNDAESPFMEPASCPNNAVPAADGSAKQANIYYPDMQGKQIVPFLVEFDVEPGLESGTELQLHYIAKATVGDESIVTPKKVRIFLVGQALCEGKQFAWGFWAKGLSLPDGAITVLDTEPDALNSLAMNENYTLLYKAYNCSNADFFNAKIVAKNPAPNALSFTGSEPFDYGPKDLKADFSFPKDTEVSGEVQVYSAMEAQSTKMEFTLSTQTGSSTETLGFSIESTLGLKVTHSPQKLNPNFSSQALSGKVMDAILQESKPIGGAKLNLQIGEGRSMTTVTDSGGNFTISGISDLQGLSKVTLTVRKAGYKTLSKEIEIGTSQPVPNPSLDCISIKKGNSPDVNIYFEKPASGAAVPSQAFSVVNGCEQAATIRIASELETNQKTDFTLNAGASKEVKVFAETMKPNPPFPIYMGEYGVEVLAKFGNEPLLPFSGPLKVARVYVTDPNSAFRLADPAAPGNANAMKSTFDIRSGMDNGLILNKNFAYFEDVRLPVLGKVHDYSPAEELFSIIYSSPSQPGVEVEKQRILDSNQDYFAETGKFTFELVDNGGYVFLDWVDFLMTDESHEAGDRHRIWAQTHRDVWANITAELPYTLPNISETCPTECHLVYVPHKYSETICTTTCYENDVTYWYPVIDNFGWVDTDVYYPQGSKYKDELTQGPIWQGQHNVCNTNLSGFESLLGACNVKDYFQGKPVTPYKIGNIANKISLESEGNLNTKLSAVRWKYLRTDKDHKGIIDFNLSNNALMGEAYALIEVEDSTGVAFTPGQEDIIVDWTLSKSGILVKANTLALLDSTTTIDQGKVIIVSVDGTVQILSSIAGICGALTATPKTATSIGFLSNKDSLKFGMSPGQSKPNIAFYTCSKGTLSEPTYFDVESPGELDTLNFGAPSEIQALVFENNSGGILKVDKIDLSYLTRESKSIKLGTGKATIPLGELFHKFEIPVPDKPLLTESPLDRYESIEYVIEDITPNAMIYFSDTKTAISPNPYASGAKIVTAASSPEEESRNQVERFHIRLLGQSQEQCIQGSVRGSTGPGAEPHVMFNWNWESIGIDSCNSSNPNFIYCDPAQFTISLIQRLEEMRRLAEENLTGNLLKLREMQQFNAYLIEDAYTDDFKQDFVESFKSQFFSGDVIEGQYPWGKYLLDSERFSFDTSGASTGQDPPSGFVDAGLHEIYIGLEFDDDQFEFFFDSPEKDLLANIKVEIVKVSEPVTQNPFYYLPFNGEVGMLADGTFDRQDYGLEFKNENQPLAIVESPLGFSLETDSSSGRKLVETKMISSFDAVNLSDRGTIMKIGQNQEMIGFAPSAATPILLQMAPKDGKVEVYYWLRDESGQIPISGAQFMNIWNGIGSTMKSASGACIDYYGNELKYGFPDKAAESGTCASKVSGSYGFSYNPAEESQLYFETVFYVPESLAINLRKSCQNNSFFYSPSLGTSTTNTPVSLNSTNSKARAVTMEDVFGLISDEYVCVSADSEYYYFWWNPQKVLSGLDDTKSKIAGWDTISCGSVQSGA